MEIAKLTLRSAGMFSNVNEVVQQLYLAEQGDYQFVIDWNSSCYKELKRNADPWNYYFRDCFPSTNLRPKPLRDLPNGEQVACTKDNIITPRMEDGNCNPLLLPKDRELPHQIITRYIVLKPDLQQAISEFALKNFQTHTIGLHIRGPGRTDGGTPELRRKFPCEYGVPFEQYFKFVDEYLFSHPEARILICSDSSYVVYKVKQRYGSKVFSYPSTRSKFGEVHVLDHPENNGTSFPKYKLGKDVIVDAYLLSQSDHFIHGNSNIVNFALCKNPLLSHDYVYAK